MRNRGVVAALLIVLGASALPAGAAGGIPANDDRADAELITSLPFHTETQIVTATPELDEPDNCPYNVPISTIWYRIPASVDVDVTIKASGTYPVFVGVYRSIGAGPLESVHCAADDSGDYVTRTTVRATAGYDRWLQIYPSNWDPGLVKLDVDKAGGVSGTVRTEAGDPLANICVYTSGGNTNGSARTAGDGTYAIPLLPGGNYRVYFQDCGNGGLYATQYYDGKDSWSQTTPVTVAPGAVTQGIDARLRRLASFSGRVLGPDAQGIGDLCIYASSSFGTARTRPDGSFIVGLAGVEPSWLVASDCTGANKTRHTYYPGVVDVEDAARMAPVAGTDLAVGDLRVERLARPAHDDRAAALNIESVPFAESLSARLATGEPGEAAVGCGAAPVNKSIWYRWRATSGARMQADVIGSPMEAAIAVYDQTLGGAPIDCQSRYGRSSTNAVHWVPTPGHDYVIQVFSSWLDEVRFHFGAAVPPANDAFAAARAVGDDVLQDVVSTVGATTETGEPSDCANTARTVWYRVDATEDGTVAIGVNRGSYSPMISVYEMVAGSPLPGGVPVACKTAQAFYDDPMRIRVKADRSYAIQVGNTSRSGTTLSLTIDPHGGASNDLRSRASVVASLPFADAVDLRAASTSLGEPLACGRPAATAWYALVAPQDGTYSVQTEGSTVDTTVAVYRARGSLSSVDALDLEQLACGDDSSLAEGVVAHTSFAATAGDRYWIQVGAETTPGTAAIQIQQEVSPANDAFLNATQIDALPYATGARTFLATDEQREPPICGTQPAGRSVWFTYTASSADTVIVDTLGSSFDTVAGVYTDDGGPLLTEFACNDDEGRTRSSVVRFATATGRTYLIRIAGWKMDAGRASVRIRSA